VQAYRLAWALHLRLRVPFSRNAQGISQPSSVPAERLPHAQDNRRSERRFRLERGFARTRCHSFDVDGAVAELTASGFWADLLRLRPARCAVLNLSKGGVSLETRTRLRIGQRVRLRIAIAEQPAALSLSGAVRWRKRLRHDRYYSVGIQFDPFGHAHCCNAPEALQVLRDLEAKYSQA
jgi:Tfp pilus assembly protein PilZ